MTLVTTNDSRILGLTGGIGSGKSAAAAVFANLGVTVIDVDHIAHELTVAQGAALGDIRKHFGEQVIGADGALDRAAMRALVFSDVAARKQLEFILHPMIAAESRRRCRAAHESGSPYVVLVIPLLVESGTYRNRVARVAVVDCSEETQVTRVMARSGLAREEVLRIMASQATREIRLAAADDVIDNGGDLERLREQIAALHQKYLALLAEKKSLAGG